MRCDEAIILVGGLGTRLRPLVSDVPKPLAPVGGRPFLAWVLDAIEASGIRRVILATGHLSEKVEEAIGRRWLRMTVDYSVETSPLGTGGAMMQASSLLHQGSAHVLNGDTFLQYDPFALERATRDAGCLLGIALARVDDTSRYGGIAREGARVTALQEKTGSGPGFINAGAYFLTPEAIAALPREAPYSFETAVLTPMASRGAVCGFGATDGFIDIGVPEDFRRAQSLFRP
ncbi:D-glycero-D-manno-heptose 1-phosphate guanosyltransferase [Lysobacter xinjiangensis]|uniref:D-glycero-D-manno-heptose 1-phosphate guanosyltransferase n=1 Tax=Cognatilysobacter xinjiangensis TaxID=546892 RepID=A0ABQ3CCU4_9GAMM|nr:nucleotidyltransferase family protein [Lysobacter xinjiangensis]GGZ70932.1 D-glycero-D-manno-heptose 1-phosphate guanosyltransferase [Lysobacter xinjiangensis]